jgi:hypothetical protein
VAAVAGEVQKKKAKLRHDIAPAFEMKIVTRIEGIDEAAAG